MRLYDLSLIIHPHITDSEFPATLEGIRKDLQAHGARELQEVNMGKQRLGYLLKGNRFGHVVYFRFESEAGDINKLKQKLQLQNEILRSMVSTVRHHLPFKLEYKLVRRKNPRAMEGASLTPKITDAAATTPQSAQPSAAPKVNMEEIDKRIDDLLNKETF